MNRVLIEEVERAQANNCRDWLLRIFCESEPAPERRVEGNTITSEHDPKLRIRLPESVRYLAQTGGCYTASRMASNGFTAADLRAGGKAYGQWPVLEKGLIERAKTKIDLKGNRQAPDGT